MSRNKPARITGAYIAVCCLAVLLTSFFHELSHWLTGEALGNSMALRINVVYPLSGAYMHPTDNITISAAGPLFTILQAVMFYLLIQWKENYMLYPFLLIPLYMRFLACALTAINPNDEARISSELGIGTYTIPLIVCALLLLLVYLATRKQKWSLRFSLRTLGFIILFSSILILTDQYLQPRIL